MDRWIKRVIVDITYATKLSLNDKITMSLVIKHAVVSRGKKIYIFGTKFSKDLLTSETL